MCDYIVTESRDKQLVMAWQGEDATDARDELEAALNDAGIEIDPETGVPVELVAQLEAYRQRMGMAS